MATKTRAARVIQFAEIEQRFELVPLRITVAPRGYARDYKPGRIPVEELDAAVARYAEAVQR